MAARCVGGLPALDYLDARVEHVQDCLPLRALPVVLNAVKAQLLGARAEAVVRVTT